MSQASDRYGVYFVPSDDTPLAHFGHRILGRDAEGGAVSPWPELPTVPVEWIAAPARYGFHATLKPPFRLATGVSREALMEAVGGLAARHDVCPLVGLTPQAVNPAGGFTALFLPTRNNPLIDTLAAACVTELDSLRAAMTAEELARRLPERLSASARERLIRWGYPHVLDGFRFHMTLSSALEPGDGVDTWRAALASVFADRVGETSSLDRLAVCHEPAPGAPFVRIAEFPLRVCL